MADSLKDKAIKGTLWSSLERFSVQGMQFVVMLIIARILDPKDYGLIGMLMIFIVYPIFKLLAKYNHTMVIAWIYVFTLIMVITFAIEIGQWYSGTGSPEMADISAGVTGFLAMFLVFAVIRGIFHLISKLFKDEDDE